MQAAAHNAPRFLVPRPVGNKTRAEHSHERPASDRYADRFLDFFAFGLFASKSKIFS